MKTRSMLGGEGILAVHRFEEKKYRDVEGGKIVVIPDSLRGNISKVRNWILDHSTDPEVVMMDDDLSEIGYYEKEGEDHVMDPQQIMEFLRSGYRMMRELGGIHLWGINLQVDPKFYREFNPFSFLSPILGTFSCHLDQKLRYDEGLFFNEDYDLWLKMIVRYRKTFRFNKYHYRADHQDASGGCANYRMLDEERKQAKLMMERWGRGVVKYNFKRSINPILNVPIKGV